MSQSEILATLLMYHFWNEPTGTDVTQDAIAWLKSLPDGVETFRRIYGDYNHDRYADRYVLLPAGLLEIPDYMK